MKLELRDIHKSFSDTEVLHGVSFNINKGRALGFLGRNGAGKTTTIRILMGLFDADRGEILLDGKPFDPFQHSIAYLPEERGMYPKQKVLDQLMYFASLRGLDKARAESSSLYWLEKLGVLEYKDKKLETLSKGNQQKVQIAQTLLGEPDIVVLDEPFSGLDPVNSQILKEIINELIEKEKLVIFSSHQMTYVEEFCEEIALINQGEIVMTGNLAVIKREFGRNRITLSATNMDLDQLKRQIQGEISRVNILETKKDYLIIELLEENTKKNLLEELTKTNIDIKHFSVYEPSLSDIFVETVGDMR